MISSLAVSPASQAIQLLPGQSYSNSISIINPVDAKDDLHYKAYIVPYNVLSGTYEANFTDITANNAITSWLTLEGASGSVPVNSKSLLNYTINVPSDAAPGGQYCAIMIQAEDPADTTNISESFEIASIIYAEIGGDNIVKGTIDKIDTPSFFTSLPITTKVTFTNTGNVHRNAEIAVELRSIFDNELIFPDKDKEQTGIVSEMIMPSTERAATFTISDLPALGVYRLKQTVSFIDDQQIIEKVIFLCPIWFIVMVIAAIALIVIAIIASVKHHKKTSKMRKVTK